MEKKINLFVENQLISNPFGISQAPPPIYKGRLIDLEAFETCWQRVVDEFIKPIETLKNIGDHRE